MKFTVVWVTSAENDLTDIWLAAGDRHAVTTSAAGIDQQLRERPEQVGESRADGRRILIAPPLAVIYRVSPDDRLVHVLQVWRTDRS